MVRIPVFVAVTVLVAFLVATGYSDDPENPPPTKGHEQVHEIPPPLVKPKTPKLPKVPKQDLRVKMLYDTDIATPYITSYSIAAGGLTTMQLSLVSKNAGRAIAPNGLYAICWTMQNGKSGAIILDPISGDTIISTPLQTSFTIMFGRAEKPVPKTMPEELPPVPPKPSPPKPPTRP